MQQKVLAAVAETFADRHEKYRKFMDRVASFIICMKKAEKEERDKVEKEKEHGKAEHKVKIKQSLSYAGGSCSKIKLTKPKKQICEDNLDYQRHICVRNFLNKVEWSEEQLPEGGITWLELYVWYTMHNGELEGIDDKKDKLRNRNSLHNEMAAFKKVVRRLVLQSVPEKEEWHFETSYARANRLKPLAISNKHPGIKGMPKVKAQEAERITRAILALKGASKRKHIEMLEKGELEMIPKPLRFRGSAMWKTLVGKFDDWTGDNESKEEDERALAASTPLRKVHCPNCSEKFDVTRKRLRCKAVLSNLKCKGCKEANSARKWTCECNCKWYKCQRHAHNPIINSRVAGVKRPLLFGIDRPPPVRRKVTGTVMHEASAHTVRRCIALLPGTVLAARFPHLVRGVSGTAND
jgi:hypothetical protein